jgi:hypothetical protein
MEPDHYKFGGGATETILHPIVLAVLLIAVAMLLVLPRRYATAAFLFATFLIPAEQQVVLAGVHIFAYRILVLAALLRMARFRQTPSLAGRWNAVDTAFSLAVVFHVFAFTLLYGEMRAVINQAGFLWDQLGCYIFLRYAIRNHEDIVKTIKCFVVLAVVFAACMVREQFTGENVFGLLGGVRLVSEVREGHIRSEAVFQHAILAGTFGATLMPLFLLLWKSAQSKLMGAMGILSGTIMTLTTACSTPVLGYVAGLIGIVLWPFRKRMRWLRWALVAGLVLLNFVMHAPVWYVIAHVGVVSGSSVSHRADLVDTFINHFDEWWLLGAKTNGEWGHDMFDTSNEYVQQGVTGGLFSLVFLIATISGSFGRIGRTRKCVEGTDIRSEWFLWLLGSALFANVVAFFGISYFDQTRVAWFALLAMISAATTKDRWRSAHRVTERRILTSASDYNIADVLVGSRQSVTLPQRD